MSDEAVKALTTRRSLLVAGGVAAATAVASVSAPVAEAANGGAVLLGRGNTATASTGVTGTTNYPALSVTNLGLGVAAAFISKNTTCLSATTASTNAYGLYVSNSGVTGNGAALVCLGTNNTGALVSTNGDLKYALSVKHGGPGAPSKDSVSGGALIDGGHRDGVVGQTAGATVSTSGVTGYHLAGGAGVYGAGGVGLQGYSNLGGGAGLQATGDGAGCVAVSCEGVNGADALEVVGTGRVTGDLYVTGTIYCANPITTPPVAPAKAGIAAAKIQRRAGRTSSRLRG